MRFFRCCTSKSVLSRFWLLASILLLTPRMGLAQPAFITNGLVAFYPFSGDFNDQSGNGLALANFGGNLGADRFGTTNSALILTNGATLSTVVPVPITSNGDRTIALWVGPISKTALPYGRLVGWGGGPLGFTTLFYRSYKPNAFAMDAGGAIASVLPGVTPLGTWTHLVWTYSTNLGLSSFYVNGVKKNTTIETGTAATQLNTTSGPLILGDISQVEYAAAAAFNGYLDEVRVYSRVLSDAEVQGLYNYDSVPEPQKVHTALATAQVVNGFIVGYQITDAGYGYTNPPGVTFVGGGGHGAAASTVISNKVVIAINPDEPGRSYNSSVSVVIDPPPFPPTQALANSSLTNDAVLAIAITDGGHGYGSTPPPVSLIGTGTGATAVATVQNGLVTAITVTKGGSGYTAPPTVLIAPPAAYSSLTATVSQLQLNLSVTPGYTFQIQSSTNAANWVNFGPAFLATNTVITQLVNVSGSPQFFRVAQIP